MNSGYTRMNPCRSFLIWSLLVHLVIFNVCGKCCHERAKYSVVMVRHGETTTNLIEAESGWYNFPLTPRNFFPYTPSCLVGENEAKSAGNMLHEHGFKFDIGYTSILERASKTLDIILEQLDQSTIEKIESWRLNPRHMGDFTGRLKSEIYKKNGGKEEVRRQLKEYDFAPPPMMQDHHCFTAITTDRRYPVLDPNFGGFPPAESHRMVVKRVREYWTEVIEPQLRAGKNVIIVTHASGLLALVYYLEKGAAADDEADIDSLMSTFYIRNSVPFVCELGENFELVNKYYIDELPILHHLPQF